jgi:ribonuclease D
MKVFNEKISDEEIQALPLKSFSGLISCLDSENLVNAEIGYLRKEKILGFDTETRPVFKKGQARHISLLQLASRNRAWIIRVNKTGIPDSLKEILENPGILKVGVAIKQDISGLSAIKPFKQQGFLDLQPFSEQFGIQDNSLKKLTANILGFRISKSQRLSNWDAVTLTQAQLEYAATDAWVCYSIYRKLAGIEKP